MSDSNDSQPNEQEEPLDTAAGRKDPLSYVVIATDRWKFKRIIGVRFKVDAEEFDLRDANRTNLQSLMNRYFEAQIDVFENKAEVAKDVPRLFWRLVRSIVYLSLALLLAGSLAYGFFSGNHTPAYLAGAVSIAVLVVYHLALRGGFRDSNIWPGYLEQRLIKLTEAKFAGVDSDIRGLIDAFTSVFIFNLNKYVRKKRWYQFYASVPVVAAAWLLWWRQDAYGDFVVVSPEVDTTLLVGAAIALGVFIFIYCNNLTHQNGYITSLDKSCETVAHTIAERMRSLSQRVQWFLRELTQLRERGQPLPTKDATDSALREMQGFTYTQLILWLAKRSEYQELYLFDKIHEMQREHFSKDVKGYIIAFLLTAFLAVMAMLPGIALWAISDWPGAIASGIAVLAVAAFGWASYSIPAWNPGADLVAEKLDSSEWETFVKLKIDAALAGQYQRALGTIAHLNEQIRRGN